LSNIASIVDETILDTQRACEKRKDRKAPKVKSMKEKKAKGMNGVLSRKSKKGSRRKSIDSEPECDEILDSNSHSESSETLSELYTNGYKIENSGGRCLSSTNYNVVSVMIALLWVSTVNSML
jgi:hypothetical protein